MPKSKLIRFAKTNRIDHDPTSWKLTDGRIEAPRLGVPLSCLYSAIVIVADAT
jgi:hypothetical protein